MLTRGFCKLYSYIPAGSLAGVLFKPMETTMRTIMRAKRHKGRKGRK